METGKRKRQALRVLRGILVLLAFSCAAVGILLVLERRDYLGATTLGEDAVFCKGVSIAGVDLGGKTRQEAMDLLRQQEQAQLAQVQFVLDTGKEAITVTAADMLVNFDTQQVIETGLALGNTGTYAQQRKEKEALLEQPVDLPIQYTLDVAPLRNKLQILKQKVDTQPKNAAVEMDLSVEGWFRYTQGEPGRQLDVDTLMATLAQRAADRAFGQVELPLVYTQPEITVEQLQERLVKRGSAETSFARSPYNRTDRVFNVKKAAGLINGFVLKPGETFSTNDTLGPRTYELGWKPAPAYVRGATEDQAGGGVCQVSSTLYAAVVKADLEIVYRRNHSSTVGYIPRGLDATINTGTIDFQFKNNTSSDIYIFAYTVDSDDGEVPQGMDDKTVHVEVFGAPLPEAYDEIRLESEKIETLHPSQAMEVVVDTTVPSDYYKEDVKRSNGSRWQSYKVYYKNGVEINREELAESVYKAWAGKITVGVGYYAATSAA